MALSINKRGRTTVSTDEPRIIRLVTSVRENNDELAFLQLKSYLDFYVKLFGHKYRIPGCDSEEIEQECLFALRYKAIEDFNPKRGKFRSFAILCIRRHLFSIIKSGSQQKRRVLNESLSLDEDRSGDEGESLSLINLVVKEEDPADVEIVKNESRQHKCNKLLTRLSKLEKEVFGLYIQQYHYDEIVDELRRMFRRKRVSKKTVDNALQRVRLKAEVIADKIDFSE